MKFNEKLNVIIVISNPCSYIRRYQLAYEFIDRVKDNKDVNLYVVEMCYGKQKFIITDSNNKNHLQLRTDIPLWHKENMINLGVKHLLPKDWESFAWIDADIEFLDEDWANKTLMLLNNHDLVQLFNECLFLDENNKTSSVFTSFCKDYSYENKYNPKKMGELHPGYCWAITRKLWDNINYIYDRSFIGTSDLIFILAILDDINGWLNKRQFIENIHNHIINYKNKINQKISKIKIGYLDSQIKHYFHGQLQNRKYIERYDMIKHHKYCPNTHLEYNNNGILVPTKNCPQELLNDIMIYFKDRNEDECLDQINTNLLSNKIVEKLNVIIVISNPCLYIRRYQLAYEFINRIQKNKDVELFIVEMCYKDQKFIITKSTDKNHLQLRTDIPLWHKENMINLGVKHLLPKDWKSFAFIDADIEFLDDDWVSNTLKLLNNGYDVIQLYSKCDNLDINKKNFYTNTSFIYDYLNNQYNFDVKKPNTDWHPGFGWAMNRNIYEKINGLYDKSIIGNGDSIMLFSLLKNIREYIVDRDCPNYFADSLLRYQYNIHVDNYKYSFAYIPTTIRHHWHGKLKNRRYLERSQIFKNNNFNPYLHIRYNDNGILVPTEYCPKKLLDDIMVYFKERNEDECLNQIL